MVWKGENILWAAVVWPKIPCWCQRRMGRLVRDDRKATVTQITTSYKQGLQNTISERTTRRTLKQMGSSSKRPTWVPLLSAKNRKRRLQFAQAHQNWTIEDWKNVAWSVESRFLLRHSVGRVRFKVQGSRFFIIRHIHNHTSIISSEMQVELKKNTAFTWGKWGEKNYPQTMLLGEYSVRTGKTPQQHKSTYTT